MLITHPCVQSGVQPSNRSGLHNTATKKEEVPIIAALRTCFNYAVPGWVDLILPHQLQQRLQPYFATYKAGTQSVQVLENTMDWIPAYAGMTNF